MASSRGQTGLWVVLVILALPFALILGLLFAGGGAKQEETDSDSQCGPGDTTISVSADAPEQVKKYKGDLEAAANVSGVPASLLAAQIEAESQWNAGAKSPVGAAGLTQFMPGTWSTYGEGSPTDPKASIKAQGKYLKVLRDTFKDKKDWGSPTDLVFAAYNAGEGAVQAHHGIPPYAETQGYVKKINGLKTKYDKLITSAGIENSAEADDDASLTSTSSDDSCGTGTGKDNATSGKDDYPFKDVPHCNGDYSSCPGVGTALGFYGSECVDFAAWRVNQQFGGTKDKIIFDNFVTDPKLGDAQGWKAGWEQLGWDYGTTPKKGAVVWYAPGKSGASPMGHVAVVKDVKGDNEYVEEGYNGLPAPNDHQYYTKTLKNDAPSFFLYVDPEKKP